jgi:transposase
MALYRYIHERPAHKPFRWWWNWAQLSRLSPIKRLLRMMKRCVENVIPSLRHRIANAGSESLNAKIQ